MLEGVREPARYTGGELNQIVKPPEDVEARVALCFPDTYEVGMSHLGLKILYHVLNKRSDTYAERAFAPWVDMEASHIKHNAPLYSLETYTPLNAFDIVGFTLQYEMSYTNVLNMLKLGGIPLLSEERDSAPIVIAGGPCAFNPEPLADFIDLFVIGDGEEVTPELVELYIAHKRRGFNRESFLLEAASMQGVYVPRFYRDGERLRGGVPERITKRVVKNLDDAPFPDDIIVPYHEAIHDRVTLEIARGCGRGCRFCQAGMIYRPVRERSADKLVELARRLVDNTGYEEISLSSLSAGDYSRLDELAGRLNECFRDRRVSLSLPSLRIDGSLRDALENTTAIRRASLTFAPEAGTQRLRDVIRKGVTEENLLDTVSAAFDAGYSSLKLYFMIGLPTETFEDLDGIAALVHKVVYAYGHRRPPLSISVSTASFVPKPHTPFQWAAQDDARLLVEKQKHLSGALKMRGVKYHWHEPYLSVLEAAFARGDRRLGAVLLEAHRRGLRFDSWSELFNWHEWQAAFKTCGMEPETYARRAFGFDEKLPWEHIDAGVRKELLVTEMEKALSV